MRNETQVLKQCAEEKKNSLDKEKGTPLTPGGARAREQRMVAISWVVSF